ncbi:hypothetical protein D3C79_922350 [compost metagenome]
MVLIPAYDPARRLNDLAHAWVQIGIVKTGAKLAPQALLELLVDGVDLGQAERGDKRPDQPRAG